MLTPDDVRNVVFGRAWRKERGYDEAEVDHFLGRVEATLRGKRLVTARDVLTMHFSPRKRGGRAYKKNQVDEFLDKVALTLMKLEVRAEERGKSRSADDGVRGERAARKPDEIRPKPEETGSTPLPQRHVREPSGPARIEPAHNAAAQIEPAPIVERAPEEPGRPERFRGLQPATSQSSALDKAEVDAFMDRVQATLRGMDDLTPNDVLNARFNLPAPGMPGYDEAGVLAFLVMVSSSIRNITRTNMRAVTTGTNLPPVTATGTQMRPVTATGTNMRPVGTGTNPPPAAGTGTNLPPVAAQTGAFPTHAGDGTRPPRQRMIPGRRRPPRR
ncbi:DivIVA domain-containing protein [Saccharopolyspora sp. TS4A08]|uniref:Cell wall synthesis protein Wag31 n=1 Tax=Saccharopolyspora ipomoeae TaxID=3042027 RepID=A0ABT6PX73_9PSEU|nr:DivIVA domain-containing protein [Saccharopolyspora sp. TS4A08]MDI2032228.1 DivIVA domain-containing protein [Saccharopolyspora sp. TS4A08]